MGNRVRGGNASVFGVPSEITNSKSLALLCHSCLTRTGVPTLPAPCFHRDKLCGAYPVLVTGSLIRIGNKAMFGNYGPLITEAFLDYFDGR